MTTGELIGELRGCAEVQGAGSLKNVLLEAADQLEELDERVAIVSAECAAAENAINN